MMMMMMMMMIIIIIVVVESDMNVAKIGTSTTFCLPNINTMHKWRKCWE
jgi:hypothetical protein